MDADLKKCFELLGLDENSTFEDARASYKHLTGQLTSWDDIKEITWAYESIKEHFSSRNVQNTGNEPTNDHQHGALLSKSVIERKRYQKTVFIALSLFFIFIAAFFLVILRYNVFDISFFRKDMDLSTLIKSVKPSIVTIGIGETQRGSGFLVSKDGYIVTNAHVMRDKNGKVFFSDGTTAFVELVMIDPDRDFALLKAAGGKNDYTFLPLGNSAKCSEGDTVVAAGTPLSFETSFTKGIVSSSKRSFPAYKSSFIQTDAALSPGNSGGPLINMRGEVVGINTLKVSGKNVEGIGFAVSIDDVKHHILGKRHMSDDDLSREIARVEGKIEEMNAWRNDASRNTEKSLKDRQIEEQWEYERRKREFYNKVDEANRSLKEQRDREEQRLREETDNYRRKMREQMEAKRKALSECLQTANYYYQQNWNDACRSIGQQQRCRLSYSAANILEQRLIQQRNECYRLYPQ